MSCTPTSISRSLSPLSPSDESRFVPRSSVASSINERHFTTAEKADGGEVQRKEVADANESKATNAAPTVVQDDDEGIVGATICFTPEASPRSGPRPSPMLHDAVQNLESLTTSNSNNYIGSVNGVASGSTGLEAVLSGSAMHSSAMQVASSLDGRSTTEYEILDGISSKGTIEVEDLILDEEDGEEYAAETELEVKSDVGRAAPLASVSPCRTVASLDEAPLETFKTDKVHSLLDAPTTPKPTLKVDTTLDGDEVDASPKVDDRPLNPFQHLHRYWEAQSNFAHMTKSAFGRFIRREAPQPGDLGAGANDPKQAAADGSSTLAEESGSAGKKEGTARALPVAAAKTYVSGLAGHVASFVVSAVMMIMMFLRGSLPSSLVSIWYMLGRILVPKASIIAQESMEAGKTLQNEAPASAESPQDPPAPSGGNQSKLFADESFKEDSKGGLDQGSIPQEEVDESTQECNAAVDAVALGVPKKSNLHEMVYIVPGILAVHLRKALAVLKSSRLLFAMTSCCVLVNIVLLCAYMLRRGAGIIQESGSGIRQELVYRTPTLDGDDLPYTPFDEDFLHCALTRTASYAAVPIWELNFSPFFDSEEASSEARTGSWLWVFGILSTMTSLLCALVFQPDIPFLSKPKAQSVLTGIWTEDEHQQFLRGYNIHGSRWKLVSAFVPTRTHTQVRSHGSYWLRIRSPETTMKKTRRIPTPKSAAPVTPKRMVPDTPGSVSSTKTTPKRSNRSRSTPAKGILVQKDHNKLFKNVTPRSEGRVKRMKKEQGFMSDPPKRRVRIQTP